MQYIVQNSIPEWKDYYIDYGHLAELLKCLRSFRFRVNIMTNNHQVNCYSDEEISLINRTSDTFSTVLKSQITKFQRFLYYKTEHGLQPVLLKLIYNVKNMQESSLDKATRKALKYKIRKEAEKFYKEISMVRSYIQLNQKIFYKLASKYKIRFREIGYYEPEVCSNLAREFGQKGTIAELKRLDAMSKVVEMTYMEYFHSRKEYKGAMARLANLTVKDQFSLHEAYMFGFAIGAFFICCVMCTLILGETGFFQPNPNDFSTLQFPIFRGSLTLFLYIIVLGINVYAWEKFNVNYKNVLGFATHASTAFQVMKRAFMFLAFWVMLFTYCALSSSSYFDAAIFFDTKAGRYATPLIWVPFLIYMLFPVRKYFNSKGRAYFYRTVGEALLAVMTFASYHAWWFVNQLQSLIIVIRDFSYSICYTANINKIEDIKSECIGDSFETVELCVILIPIIWAFLLDLNRLIVSVKGTGGLINSSRYSLSCLRYIFAIFTTILSDFGEKGAVMFFVWLLFFIVTTALCIFCDVKYDWGFMNEDDLLRKKLAYSKRTPYYSAIIANVVLRIFWTISISPFIWTSPVIRNWSYILVCFAELLRRLIWNSFSVEIEHLKLEGNFNGVQKYDFPFDFEIDMSNPKIAKAVELQVRHYLKKGLFSEEYLFNFAEIEAVEQMVALIDRPHITKVTSIFETGRTEVGFASEVDERKNLGEFDESLKLCNDIVREFAEKNIGKGAGITMRVVAKNTRRNEVRRDGDFRRTEIFDPEGGIRRMTNSVVMDEGVDLEKTLNIKLINQPKPNQKPNA